LREAKRPELTINWRYFSLDQVNSREGPGWKLWSQPDDYPSRSLRAFKAAEAARRQGKEAFERYHFALLAARHDQGRNIASPEVLRDVAGTAGLDLGRFEHDLADPSILDALARDHTHAVEAHGVFGIPTLVFPGGYAVYLKISQPVPEEEEESLFDEVLHIATGRPYLMEVKRP
jgi:predicted DsbA family dithiol-disulfide isomerase